MIYLNIMKLNNFIIIYKVDDNKNTIIKKIYEKLYPDEINDIKIIINFFKETMI